MDFLFRIRSRTVLFLLILWAGLASAILFHYSVSARGKYLDMGDKLAWKEGTIPAPRGRIFDKDGKALAWTEKYFDLFLISAKNMNIQRENEILSELAGLLISEPRKIDEETVLLKKNLSPEEIVLLDMMVSKYPELKIMPRNERRYIDYSRVRTILGNVRLEDGRMSGNSGLEHKYDKALSGSEGFYVVMLDKQGNWVRGTWKLLRKPRPGNDLILEKSVEELKKEIQ